MAKNKKEEAAPVASTALAVLKAQALLPENVVFDELIENLKEMDEIGFPRVRIRQGKFFFSEEDEGVEEFEGVVLYYGRQNTYWEGTFDANNVTPPDCFSVDGEEGSKPRDAEGRFGSCKDCALNQFGSGVGKGKACRNQLKLYIQVLGTTVPATLFLPPTSLSSFTNNYIMNRVTQKGLNYFKVVTKIKAYQKDKETFFRVNFDVSGVFKDEEAVQVKKFRDFWLEAIKRDRSRFDASAMGGNDESASTRSSPPSVPTKKSEKAPEKAPEKNLRTVTPRQPAPVAADESAETANVVDDDEPPF